MQSVPAPAVVLSAPVPKSDESGLREALAKAFGESGSGPDLPPSLLQTLLPDRYLEAYRLKLSGASMEELTDRFHVDRTTIWRWCSAVEREYTEALEQNPTFNSLALEIKKLTDLEELNRQKAATAKSERAAAMFLNGARQCCHDRTALLLDVGIFERAPERLYKVVANMKPIAADKVKAVGQARSRTELISDLVEKLANLTQL